MSGIAGIYHMDGRPASREMLVRMTTSIMHRGPDGEGNTVSGPVGFGHTMLHTTPESLQERQPRVDSSGLRWITMDGRIDNRAEIIDRLRSFNVPLENPTDTEIVLVSYCKWGAECVRHFAGNFAFAIWDARDRCLFCARDIMGLKPFYYSTAHHTFLFASELPPIFESGMVEIKPNERMIAQYLAATYGNTSETLYRHVFRLPPAHYLVVTPDGIRLERYWDATGIPLLKYRSDEEYAEHFRNLLKCVVRNQLRSHGRAGAYLSGGLDSSTVVSAVKMLVDEGSVDSLGFETFSLVYPNLKCDESPYIREFSRCTNIKSNLVDMEFSGYSWFARQAGLYRDFPDYPHGAAGFHKLDHLASRMGFRVLLTGNGGDCWFRESPYAMADDLRHFRFGHIAHKLRNRGSFRNSLSSLFRYGIRPLAPDILRRLKKAMKNPVHYDWIGKELRSYLNSKAADDDIDQSNFAGYAQRYLYETSTSGRQIHSEEMNERFTARVGIEQRHPFFDRRLIEFGLSLPEEQRSRNGLTKYIFRNAMKDQLPPSYRERAGRPNFAEVFVKTFETPETASLLSSLRIADLGWVDADQAWQLYRDTLRLYVDGDEDYSYHVIPLWMIIGIELWYRICISGYSRAEVEVYA